MISLHNTRNSPLSFVRSLFSPFFLTNPEQTRNPDDGVYVPPVLRYNIRYNDGLINAKDIAGCLRYEGMADLGLYFTLKFLDGDKNKQIRLLEEWVGSLLGPNKGSQDRLADICTSHLKESRHHSTLALKAHSVFLSGPEGYFRSWKENLKGLGDNELPVFIAYSGLLGLRAFIASKIEEHKDSKLSFCVYFTKERMSLNNDASSPLLYFEIDKGRLKGRRLAFSEIEGLVKDRGFHILDDAIRTGDTIRGCQQELRNYYPEREIPYTVRSVCTFPKTEDEKYLKWLIRHRPLNV